MDSDLWLVAGLGNPEQRYQGNRHNVGFLVVDALAAGETGLRWKSASRFSAEVAKGRLGGGEVVLVKPLTFMNLSGRSVGPLAAFYGVTPERVVVVHDDVDLELGRLRLKLGGGDGGHKGIRSVAQGLGSLEFVRVRCGVGRPTRGEVADFVLQDFRPEERALVDEEVRRGVAAIETVLRRGLRSAMNEFNGPPAAQDSQPAGRTDEQQSKKEQ